MDRGGYIDKYVCMFAYRERESIPARSTSVSLPMRLPYAKRGERYMKKGKTHTHKTLHRGWIEREMERD